MDTKLTPRQIEVLQDIVDNGCKPGNRNAETLFISKHTLSTHKLDIYKRLKVHNLTDALIKAIKLGLVKV
jgi:DNA-binding CsgD family transcriptional regulator